MRIHLRNTSVHFNDKCILDHLCNYLINTYNHPVSIPVFHHLVSAKLGVNNDVTCCCKQEFLLF